MNGQNNIVAIEMGSSKIQAIAVKKLDNQSYTILAYAKEDAKEFIKKGKIINIDLASDAILRLKKQLESAIGQEVTKAYVAFSAKGIHSQKSTVSQGVPGGEKVTQEIVDQLFEENRANAEELGYILDVEPQEYLVGNNKVQSPVGNIGESITAEYLNIIGKEEITKNLELSFQAAGLEIAESFLIPKMEAAALLKANDKKGGCVLVDLGAGTTTVSIYKAQLLRRLTVLPFGQELVTRDLESLRMEYEDAEQLKMKYLDTQYLGSMDENSKDETIQTLEGRQIKKVEFHKVAMARIDEIIKNVQQQIILSGLHDKLLNGIILCGGGSQIPNIEEEFRKVIKELPIKTVTMPVIDCVPCPEAPQLKDIPALLGLIEKACEDCFQDKKEEEKKPVPAPVEDDITTGVKEIMSDQPKPKPKKKTSLFGDIFNKVVNTFGDDDEEEIDPAEAERKERERKEKEERKRKAAERKRLEKQRKEEEKKRKESEQGSFFGGLFNDDDM